MKAKFRKLIFAGAVLTALAGMSISCATTRIMPGHDSSDYHRSDHVRVDSARNSLARKDSIYIRDSIFVYQKGDTVTKYVEKTVVKYRAVRDTVFREKLVRDTAFIEKRDSVTVRVPVEVIRPVKWYDRACIWLGRLCCIAVLIWGLFLYLKRRR